MKIFLNLSIDINYFRQQGAESETESVRNMRIVAAMARLLAAAPGTRRVAAVMWSSLALADTATALCLVTAHTAPDTVRCL